MTQDALFICEIVLGAVFGAVLVAIAGLGVHACVRRSNRVTVLQQQCVELTAQAEEKQQKLKWLTGVDNLAENESLFADETTSNGSFASRGSRK